MKKITQLLIFSTILANMQCVEASNDSRGYVCEVNGGNINNLTDLVEPGVCLVQEFEIDSGDQTAIKRWQHTGEDKTITFVQKNKYFGQNSKSGVMYVTMANANQQCLEIFINGEVNKFIRNAVTNEKRTLTSQENGKNAEILRKCDLEYPGR